MNPAVSAVAPDVASARPLGDELPLTRRGPAVSRPGFLVPAPLVLLSAVPVTAGDLRLVQLAGGPGPMPADDRFPAFPAAIVFHGVGAAVHALVGAFQFLPRFRRRHPAWHRRAGRVLVVAGLLVAGSALWLTLFYPPEPGTGDLLYAIGLAAGTQVVTEGSTTAILGTGELAGDLAKGAGWVVNLAVAAWVVRRPLARRTGTRPAAPAPEAALP